jgi:hypothetical protein
MNIHEAYSLIEKNPELEEVVNHYGDYVILQKDAGKPVKDVCDWIKERQKK